MSGYLRLNKIGLRGKPGELKHLSNPRKRKKLDFLSSGERTGKSLNHAYVKAASVVCVGSRDIDLSVCRPAGKLQNYILVE